MFDTRRLFRFGSMSTSLIVLFALMFLPTQLCAQGFGFGFDEQPEAEKKPAPKPKFKKRVKKVKRVKRKTRSSSKTKRSTKSKSVVKTSRRAPASTGWQIDIGILSQDQEAADSDFADFYGQETVDGSGFKLQASKGMFTSSVGYVGYEDKISQGFGETEKATGAVFSGAIGVGKLINLGTAFQVHPRAQVGFVYREMQAVLGFDQKRVFSGTGLGGSVGTALRVRFGRIGVYFDLDFFKDLAETERDGETLTQGSSLRTGLGVSLFTD